MYLSTCFYSQGYAKKVCIVLAGYKVTPGFGDGLEGTACSCPQRYGLSQQRSQSKISKGNRRHMGPNSEETSPDFQSLPMRSYKVCLIPPATNCDNTCEMFKPGKLIRDSAPKVFIGVLSCKHSLPLHLANSRVPKGKQVFSINQLLGCLSSSGTMRCPPKIQVPRHQPKANFVGRLF